MSKRLVLYLMSTLVFAACGETRAPGATFIPDDPPVVGPACADPDGPTVTVLSPPPGNLAADILITDTRPVVVCEAIQNLNTVNADSVAVEVTDATPTTFAPTVNAIGSDQYESAPVDLANSPNGAITITCQAEDTASPDPRCNSVELDTFLDLGPIVTISDPATSPEVRGRSMTVRFSVEESLVAPGDTGSMLPPGFVPEVLFAGSTMPNVVNLGGGNYEVEIDFTDPAIFTNEISNGAAYLLVVRATNNRGITREVTRDVVVDLLGPDIKFNAPVDGQLAVGVTTINVTVTDALSEVDENSVFFVVDVVGASGDPILIPMEQSPDDDDVYVGAFDVNEYPVTVTQITINVIASDTVGNESTASATVALDVVSPIASLDPPPVREGREGSDGIECSESFDPLGADTPNDGTIIGNSAEFRARIEERGNDAVLPMGVIVLVSGINDQDVQLYIRRNDGTPLVVNSDPTDTNEICDAINPDINPDPAAKEVVIRDFIPFAPAGGAFYNDQGVDPLMPDPNDWNDPSTSRDDDYFTIYQAACDLSGDDEEAPEPVCEESSPLTRIIDSPVRREVPTVYGPTRGVEGECVGAPTDLSANFEGFDGWLCAALRVTDNSGNENVSAPIRVCLSHSENPIAPECLTPPPPISDCGVDLNPGDGITPGTCVPERFTDFPGLQYIPPP